MSNKQGGPLGGNALAIHRRMKLNQLRQSTFGGGGTLRLNGQRIEGISNGNPPPAPQQRNNHQPQPFQQVRPAAAVRPNNQQQAAAVGNHSNKNSQPLPNINQRPDSSGRPPNPIQGSPPLMPLNMPQSPTPMVGNLQRPNDFDGDYGGNDNENQPFSPMHQTPPTPLAAPGARPLSEMVTMSENLLGRGAYGAVYLGIHDDTGQMIAVKKIHIGSGSDEAQSQIDVIVQEITLMRQLSHPNIVKYLHAERQDRDLCIYMEYCSNGTLTSLMKKMGGRLKPGVVRTYMRSALRGVQYLHRKNIVHRDIKAENILLSGEEGEAKLSDFGTSREFNDSANLLTVTGTPCFMAPEVVKGSGHGAAADIWSIGATMIHLLSGQVPFGHVENPVAVMYQIATFPEKVFELLDPTWSPELQDVIRQCMSEDPATRPTSTQLLEHPFFAATTSYAPPAVVAEENRRRELEQRQISQNRNEQAAARQAAAMSALQEKAMLAAGQQQQQQYAQQYAQQQQQQQAANMQSTYATRLRDETQNNQVPLRQMVPPQEQYGYPQQQQQPQQEYYQQQQVEQQQQQQFQQQRQQDHQRQSSGQTIRQTYRPQNQYAN